MEGSKDSWLLITKNTVDEDINSGNNPETKTTEDMEDSDGISVISESEMFKAHGSDGESLEKTSIPEEVEDEMSDQDAKNNDENPSLLTPPHTPTRVDEEPQLNAIKKYEEFDTLREIQAETPMNIHKSNHAVFILIFISLVIAVLYTNVSSLKHELSKTISHYEQRILRLEEENQMLKTQLDELMEKLSSQHDISSFKAKVPKKVEKFQDVPKPQPPPTKTVWLGGEEEQVVKVLDKKLSSLPDYCYFTDENDLFYEYNMENCEKKKQKLEGRNKKVSSSEFAADKDALSADDIYKSKDDNYNKFMSKTADDILISLNAEIQEIKNSRRPLTSTRPEDRKVTRKFKVKSTSDFEGSAGKRKRDGNLDEKEPKKRNGKKKETSSGDWADQRSKAREDARNKKENDENWYLKRKNEREINRLQNIRN